MSTQQRNSISAPATGLLIFNTDKNCFEYWNGNYWQPLQNCYNYPIEATMCPNLNYGLVGWWTFNDSTATDLSGNGNNGTLFGNPCVVCYTNYSQTNCFIDFDGVDDYVEIPNSPSLNITGPELTIIAWVMDRDPNGGNAIINKEMQYEIEIRHSITKRITAAFDTVTNGANWAWIHPGIQAPINQWVMYAVVYDSGLVYFYLDGRLVAIKENFSSAGPGNPATSSIGGETHPLRFGARDASPTDGIADNFRKIALDEVRIYNRALSPEEIMCIYLLGITHN